MPNKTPISYYVDNGTHETFKEECEKRGLVPSHLVGEFEAGLVEVWEAKDPAESHWERFMRFLGRIARLQSTLWEWPEEVEFTKRIREATKL